MGVRAAFLLSLVLAFVFVSVQGDPRVQNPRQLRAMATMTSTPTIPVAVDKMQEGPRV